MRIFKRILLILGIILLIFVGHILVSTGFFRTIEPTFDGKILKTIAIPGAEDISISTIDSFALISSTRRMSHPTTKEEKGGLYLIDLKTKELEPVLLSGGYKKPFAPHGISMFKKESSYQIMAINHTYHGHTIEVFELIKQELKHIRTLKSKSMIQPNDLVLVGENQFYFTNDHKYLDVIGRLAEDYLGFAFSNVVYFDGDKYTSVADGIAYANGINYDPNNNLLFVASPRYFLIKVYKINEDATLTFIENIPCGTGVDNIEFDEEGNLWIGAHPNLLRFSAYAQGKKETAPSEIIKITYRKKGEYSVEKIYIENGDKMSASSVATTFGNLIFTGNVMDDHFLILERNNSSSSQ